MAGLESLHREELPRLSASLCQCLPRWLHPLLCDKEEEIDNVLQRVKEQVAKDGHSAEDENMSEACDDATDDATVGVTDDATGADGGVTSLGDQHSPVMGTQGGAVAGTAC